jgi:hypothetical protein
MSWKDKLHGMMFKEDQNIDEAVEQATEVKGKDIGFVNDVTGAGILARENGKLEGFADYGLGFRFDPGTQTFSLFAPNVKLFTANLSVHEGEESFQYFKNEFADVMALMGHNVKK